MVTVYTELSIKDWKNNKLATLNHNPQENSNLIMPFLVQNDDKMIKGLLTLLLRILKIKQSFFFLKMRSISLKCIKLYLCDDKTGSKANLFADCCLGMCLMRNIQSKINEGTRKACYILRCCK